MYILCFFFFCSFLWEGIWYSCTRIERSRPSIAAGSLCRSVFSQDTLLVPVRALFGTILRRSPRVKTVTVVMVILELFRYLSGWVAARFVSMKKIKWITTFQYKLSFIYLTNRKKRSFSLRSFVRFLFQHPTCHDTFILFSKRFIDNCRC